MESDHCRNGQNGCKNTNFCLRFLTYYIFEYVPVHSSFKDKQQEFAKTYHKKIKLIESEKELSHVSSRSKYWQCFYCNHYWQRANGNHRLFKNVMYKLERVLLSLVQTRPSKYYSSVHYNISSVLEFQRWWVLKSKLFAKNQHAQRKLWYQIMIFSS